MITPEHARMMARYNAWQNHSLYAAADALSDAQRTEDKGAFFKSIYGTLCHLYWGDTAWMARLTASELPKRTIAQTVEFNGGWPALKTARLALDARIAAWARGLTQADIDSDLTWFSGAMQREFIQPRGALIVHFFNHQTHHRGQVHALLTSFGARPDDTDIPFMDLRWAKDAAEPYTLRDPRPGDLGQIISRQGKLYADEYGWDWTFESLVAEIVGQFGKSFIPGKERCWIAEYLGQVVGSVFVVRQDDETAKLRLLYVDKAARGLGIGGRLVEECLSFARAAGYRRMVLWTNDILHSARKIYEAAGFELIEQSAHRSFGQDLVGQTWARDL